MIVQMYKQRSSRLKEENGRDVIAVCVSFERKVPRASSAAVDEKLESELALLMPLSSEERGVQVMLSTCFLDRAILACTEYNKCSTEKCLRRTWKLPILL